MIIGDNYSGFVNYKSGPGTGFCRHWAVEKIIVDSNIADVYHCSAAFFINPDVFFLVGRKTGYTEGSLKKE
jgi:hypothetical protein